MQNVEITSSIKIKLEKWKFNDWKIFSKCCLSKCDLETPVIQNLATILAEFLIRNDLEFSPSYIEKLIVEFGYLYKIRLGEINNKFDQIRKVCDSIDDAHKGFDKLKLKSATYMMQPIVSNSQSKVGSVAAMHNYAYDQYASHKYNQLTSKKDN